MCGSGMAYRGKAPSGDVYELANASSVLAWNKHGYTVRKLCQAKCGIGSRRYRVRRFAVFLLRACISDSILAEIGPIESSRTSDNHR